MQHKLNHVANFPNPPWYLHLQSEDNLNSFAVFVLECKERQINLYFYPL